MLDHDRYRWVTIFFFVGVVATVTSIASAAFCMKWGAYSDVGEPPIAFFSPLIYYGQEFLASTEPFRLGWLYLLYGARYLGFMP